MPFKRIAARLNVSVSTVHSWTRDIRLTPEQLAHNLRGPRGPQNPLHIARRVETWRRKHRELRLAYQEEGRQRARQGDALSHGWLHALLGGGGKAAQPADVRELGRRHARILMRFLRDSLGVKPEDCQIRLNVYTNNGLPLKEIERHWLRALELPASCLRGHSLNHYPTSSSGKKRKKLPYGVCSLTVARSTHLLQHIFGAIQEYADFDEPRWLDGPPRKSQAGRHRTAAAA
jgi:hypothetical protein